MWFVNLKSTRPPAIATWKTISHLFAAQTAISRHTPFTMSLPVIKRLAELTDFHKTVLPYLPQLYDLPQQILQSYNNPTELKNLYIATNPLISGFAFSLFLAPLFLLVSEVNKNYSQVDRMWSILPTVYNAHFCLYAHMNGLQTARLDNLVAFSVIWSVSTDPTVWRYALTCLAL